jgi:hypothetical protein
MLSWPWPADFRAVQRVILTVGRRQYVADGVLTATPADGLHLAVVSPLGLVTEVACSSDGRAHVLRTTPLMSEDWARDYVARDLARLFVLPANPLPAGQLADGQVALETPVAHGVVRYLVHAPNGRVEAVEEVQNGRRTYRARFREARVFAPWPRPLPTVIEVDAGSYQLWIRMVRISLNGAPAPATNRGDE